jgi:hypothetical protein
MDDVLAVQKPPHHKVPNATVEMPKKNETGK